MLIILVTFKIEIMT